MHSLAAVPEVIKGSGGTCACDMHREKCLFGRQHSWSSWYENGRLMRTRTTFHCWVCGGVCTSEEAAAPAA